MKQYPWMEQVKSLLLEENPHIFDDMMEEEINAVVLLWIAENGQMNS